MTLSLLFLWDRQRGLTEAGRLYVNWCFTHPGPTFRLR
jgi:hypothetical protein